MWCTDLLAVDEKIDQVHRTAEKTNSKLEHDRIHDWLSPADPTANHHEASSQRHQGTGQWFINHSAFQSFKSRELACLWLYGIPGCGKTVLSSSIIEDLQQPPSQPISCLVYFYSDFNDSTKQTLDSALRSLISQLSKQSEDAFRELSQSCEANGKEQPSTQLLRELLCSMLSVAPHTRVILDALDESTTRSHLLQWISNLLDCRAQHTQIVVTGRPEYEIEQAMRKLLPQRAIIALDQQEVNADIGAYIHARIRFDPEMNRWRDTPQVQDEIEKEITTKANGR